MVGERASIYHKKTARAVDQHNMGTLNFDASIYITVKLQRHNSESVADPHRAHTWISWSDTFTDLPFEEIFGPFRYDRSRHHWFTRTRPRDGSLNTTSPHRWSDGLTSGPSRFCWSLFATEPVGSHFVDSYLERHGLGFRGLCGGSHDLAVNSRAIHLSKVALDVGSRPSRLRDRPRNATEKAASVFAYSMIWESTSKMRSIELAVRRQLQDFDNALSI
jgi:hypothetical protein